MYSNEMENWRVNCDNQKVYKSHDIEAFQTPLFRMWQAAQLILRNVNILRRTRGISVQFEKVALVAVVPWGKDNAFHYRSGSHMRYRIMYELPWVTIFGLRVGRFANNFYEWLRHSWKLYSKRITSVILFLTRYFISWTHNSANNIMDHWFRLCYLGWYFLT